MSMQPYTAVVHAGVALDSLDTHHANMAVTFRLPTKETLNQWFLIAAQLKKYPLSEFLSLWFGGDFSIILID